MQRIRRIAVANIRRFLEDANLFKHEFGKRNLLGRFGKMFCHSDIINYGNLHNIDFIRTQTLCQGGEKCDFCFVRHRKGEVWERSKSV